MAMAVVVLLLLLPILLLFLALRLSLRWRHPHLPAGSLGLPLLGETLHLISAYKTDNPEPFVDARVRRHGRVFTTHVFGEPTVFVTGPDSNRFVLQSEGRLFESSYPGSISTLLGRRSLLIMKQGQLHKKLHSLTINFAGAAMIRDHLLPDIDRLVWYNLEGWDGSRIHLQDETKKITFELTVKQLMSFDPGEWTERLRREYLLVIQGFFSLPIPFFFSSYGRALKARAKVADMLRGIVQERYRHRAEVAEEEEDTKKDMLGMLMENDEELSEEHMVDFMLALLVAGYETTSTIMTLAIKFLTETPLALSQLKEEHDGIRSRKRSGEGLDWSDYKAMLFTQCVINETLRVANIIGGVFRRAVDDVPMKEYIIPKGWRVFTSFRSIHLDSELYNDAPSFNPWRWQESSSPPNSTSFFTPFGGGPRLCPGYELARVEIAVFLHHLLTGYTWEPAENDKLIFFPTTRMVKRYPINVRRRKLS